MMDPSTAFDKFSPTKKPPLARKLSIKDKRVNELLGSEPGVSCSPRVNMENKGRQEDRNSVELAGDMSASSSPLQDVARYALQAMEKLRMDGSEVTPGLGFSRKTSMLRPYHGGSRFQSVDGSSFMSPEDVANGAEFPGSFCARDAREMDATNQSLTSDMHVGQQGMFSKPIPGKRKRGRPPKTDLSRLSKSQKNPSKKRKLDEEDSNGNILAGSSVQGSVIEAGEGLGRAQLIKGHKKRASILKPISENAPKRRGRPPKHLTAPSRQPILGGTIPGPNSQSFQNGPNDTMAPANQEGLNSGISNNGHDKLQEINGSTLSVGDQVSNSTQRTVSGTTVKKRGPGRPRKTEMILPSIEVHPEDLTKYDGGAQDASGGSTKKGEQDQPRTTENLQLPIQSKSANSTPQTHVPANVDREEQRKHLYSGELSPLEPNPMESISEREPRLSQEAVIPPAPQAAQQTWTSNVIEGDPHSPPKGIELSQYHSKSQERNTVSDLAAVAAETVIVKKRRGRPPKNKSTVAAV